MTATKIHPVLEDEIILEKFGQPESKRMAFHQLVQQYQKRVYWHVRKMVISHEDADDITQEVFVIIWNKLHTFKGDSKLFTWIYRIATNECLSFLQKKKKRFFLPINDVNAELSNMIDSGADISGDEIQLKLQKALLTLPEKQRAVFNMKYFEELPYQEIAEITGTSVGALKASYHHAVKKIEAFLEGEG